MHTIRCLSRITFSTISLGRSSAQHARWTCLPTPLWAYAQTWRCSGSSPSYVHSHSPNPLTFLEQPRTQFIELHLFVPKGMFLHWNWKNRKLWPHPIILPSPNRYHCSILRPLSIRLQQWYLWSILYEWLNNHLWTQNNFCTCFKGTT